ncbi:MAG: HAD family phosphatase [Planctomycetaceae bacterium]|nr:HAD family phosphatase [Planctomycetaceae bacterium]
MSIQPRNFRAVVFDLDGLMLNTEDIFELAGQQLLARRGLTMTDEIRHGMMGRRAHEAFAFLKERTAIADPIPDLIQEIKLLFADLAEHRLQVMPGLHEVLERVDGLQLPRAVATSSPREYMTWLLTKFALLPGFQLTLTAEDVTHGKPHPEIYLSVAERFGIAPAEMLVFEDSETGTRAAAAAGAFVVSVPNRHTEMQDFSMTSLRADRLDDERVLRLLGSP